MGSPITLNYGFKRTVDYNWLMALIVDEARDVLKRTQSPIQTIGINPINESSVLVRYTLKDEPHIVYERTIDVPSDFSGADSMYALQDRAQGYGAKLADNILNLIITKQLEDAVFGKE